MGTKHTMHNDYELLDSGGGRKLERFGDVVLSRPCDQASWEKQAPETWARAAASFDRERGWQTHGGAELPSSWIVTINDIAMTLKPTPAGHLGVFPETRLLWDWIGTDPPVSQRKQRERSQPVRVLGRGHTVRRAGRMLGVPRGLLQVDGHTCERECRPEPT